MRPSFARVRSWVSSTERESPSTLPLTSPTCPLTNFFVAHAVVPPSANARTGIASTSLFICPPSSSFFFYRTGPASLVRTSPFEIHRFSARVVAGPAAHDGGGGAGAPLQGAPPPPPRRLQR